MDIFERRDALLELQGAMLSGEREKDDLFLALINFENWCSNSGLSGFAQDFEAKEVQLIKSFVHKKQFGLVVKMIEVLQAYVEQYGTDFVDRLSENEFERLSQFDDDFFSFSDEFTSAMYDDFGTDR